VAEAAYSEPLPTDTVERPLLRASVLVRREAELPFLDEGRAPAGAVAGAHLPPAADRPMATVPVRRTAAGELDAMDEMSLLELADRLLNRGVVLTGEATISVAGVDLIYLGLNVVLTAVENLHARQPERP